jgi:hypothetical protein
MPLNEAQKAVAESDKRFRVFVAGRRTGKTYLSVRELARFGRHPNKKVMYVAPTYRMCRDIIWDDLKNRLSELGWIAKTNESRLDIELVNGTKIFLRGADNPDSLRGAGYDFVVFDETADIKPEAWTEVVRPALSAQKPPGSALFCGTPKGFNWFKDLYDNAKTEDDWVSYQFTTLEGGNVPQSEIEAARRDLDEKTFKQEYEASFETYSGVVYYSFKDDNIQPRTITEEDKILYLGVDFNVSPISCVVAVKDEDVMHIVDEIVIYGSNTDELVEEIKNRYPTKKIMAFPDPAGIQRKTSASGKTDISILENAGFNVKYKRQHPKVRDRINAVNSKLCNTNKVRTLLVDSKAKHTIKALRQHTYKEGTLIPNKDDGHDHITDALGYMIDYLYPITKDLPAPKPFQQWGAI